MERHRPRKKAIANPRGPAKKPARPTPPPAQAKAFMRGTRRALADAAGRPAQGTRVVELMARRALLNAARQLLRHHIDRCTKCGSTYVSHEPAFVHCHYCGRLHRVANASLLAQELFEIRSGMRLAS